MSLNVKNNLETLGCEVAHHTNSNSRKTRLVEIKSKNQIVRIDRDEIVKLPLRFAKEISRAYDAVVISDYDKGTITEETIDDIRQNFDGPVYVDSKKKNIGMFEGFFVKINEQERNECTSLCSELIVTMGDRGAVYKEEIFTAPRVEVSDVCGAGDTFLSTLVYFHLLTGNIKLAIEKANKAAAITVQHFGTYAPTLEEINGYET